MIATIIYIKLKTYYLLLITHYFKPDFMIFTTHFFAHPSLPPKFYEWDSLGSIEIWNPSAEIIFWTVENCGLPDSESVL